jgi:magnesium transporter
MGECSWTALYSDGKREPVGMAEAVRKARSVPGSFVWLGLHEPTYDEFDDLALYFAPHPLAIEDAVNAHQRPKLDIYDECLFVVLKTLDFDEARAELVGGEIMLFTGENFMVTVQHGASKVLEPVRRRLESNRDLLRHGPSAVLHGISDAVVDDYEKIADDIEQELEKLEAHLMRVLTSARLAGIHPDMEPYFRDVSDHLARVAEKVEGFDALLTDILTANLAQISILQNEGKPAAERRHAAHLGLGRDRRREHRPHRHLRHELRQHARTPHPLRLLRTPRLHAGPQRHPLPALPTQRLALIVRAMDGPHAQ